MKLKVLLPTVLVTVLGGVFLLVSPCLGVGAPQPPPGPYIPKVPEEDIVMVEAYITQGTPNILHVTVTFAAPTPPPGQLLGIWVMRLQGSTEVLMIFANLFPPGKTAWSFDLQFIGSVEIAVYAALGEPATDRWPNEGFQKITSLSAGAPNRFFDYDSVGGVIVPTNTFLTLAPYLAVIGLVATGVGVAIKKRRN